METYVRRYQELSLLCPDMVNTETLKIERFTDGLPLVIRNDVISAKLASLHEAITLAHSLLDFWVLENTDKGKSGKRKRDDRGKSKDKSNK